MTPVQSWTRVHRWETAWAVTVSLTWWVALMWDAASAASASKRNTVPRTSVIDALSQRMNSVQRPPIPSSRSMRPSPATPPDESPTTPWGLWVTPTAWRSATTGGGEGSTRVPGASSRRARRSSPALANPSSRPSSPSAPDRAIFATVPIPARAEARRSNGGADPSWDHCSRIRTLPQWPAATDGVPHTNPRLWPYLRLSRMFWARSSGSLAASGSPSALPRLRRAIGATPSTARGPVPGSRRSWRGLCGRRR